MKILVTYDMFREGFTELESKYEVTFPEGRDFTYEEVFEMIPEYDVLCSMFDFPVNKELIDHASKLRLIANYAVGYNNIDVAYALEKGLTVANTPDPVTAPTANIALGLMLDTARRITECDRKLRTLGKDMKVGVLENLGMPVTGQTLGIIGMGRIGKALAKRANALGMDVIYHNRRQLCIEDETKLNVTYVSKEELLAKADFVSLNAPYTPDTIRTHHPTQEHRQTLTSGSPVQDRNAIEISKKLSQPQDRIFARTGGGHSVFHTVVGIVYIL